MSCFLLPDVSASEILPFLLQGCGRLHHKVLEWVYDGSSPPTTLSDGTKLPESGALRRCVFDRNACFCSEGCLSSNAGQLVQDLAARLIFVSEDDLAWDGAAFRDLDIALDVTEDREGAREGGLEGGGDGE